MNDWYESDNPSTIVRGASWRAGVWIGVVLLVVALISVGIWGFRVATSDVKGQGDAVITKNSAVNRVAAQQTFEELYAEIKSADQRIAVAADAFKANPSPVNQTNLTGLTNYCIDVVADYNALARKYNSADFRPVDLPEQINEMSATPDTDCK